MAVEHAQAHTRRALLGGALGALATFAAQAIGRPMPAWAEGETMHVGGEYFDATSTTYLRNTTNHEPVFEAQSTAGAYAIVADCEHGGVAILAQSFDDTGIFAAGYPIGVESRGFGQHGIGVKGITDYSSGTGVFGVAGPSHGGTTGPGIGVHGQTELGTGVFGATGGSPPTAPVPNHGVYGWSDPSKPGVGVRGRNDGGFGYGIFGISDNGFGVAGLTKKGNAVSATVGSKGTGRALAVAGRNAFSAAGTLTIQSGHQLGTVTPKVPLKSVSLVLATLQSDAGPGIAVEYAYVVLNPPRLTAPYIGVRLTSPAAMDATVAYFVLEAG